MFIIITLGNHFHPLSSFIVNPECCRKQFAWFVLKKLQAVGINVLPDQELELCCLKRGALSLRSLGEADHVSLLVEEREVYYPVLVHVKDAERRIVDFRVVYRHDNIPGNNGNGEDPQQATQDTIYLQLNDLMNKEMHVFGIKSIRELRRHHAMSKEAKSMENKPPGKFAERSLARRSRHKKGGH